MTKKHRLIVALGVVASAHAAYVGSAAYRSLAELRRAAETITRTRGTLSTATLPGETRATGPQRLSTVPVMLGADAPEGAATDEAVYTTRDVSEPSFAEDAAILRQRALLDVAARPELAELLESRDPEVRRAVLAFFEDP